MIDFHTHIWNTQVDQADVYVERLKAAGVEKGIVLPIAPYMSNATVAELAGRHEDTIIGFASVVPFAETTGIPREDPIQALEYAVNNLGLRGLKLHPLIQGFALDDPGLVPVVSAAGDMDIPVLFHTGPSNGRAGRMRNGNVERLDDLAIMCPRTTIVAGHADPLGDSVYLARKHPNVYLETSISWAKRGEVIPGIIKQAIEEAGPEKVLFGTDFSLGRDERLTETIDVISQSGISDDVLMMVFGANAERVLKI